MAYIGIIAEIKPAVTIGGVDYLSISYGDRGIGRTSLVSRALMENDRGTRKFAVGDAVQVETTRLFETHQLRRWGSELIHSIKATQIEGPGIPSWDGRTRPERSVFRAPEVR